LTFLFPILYIIRKICFLLAKVLIVYYIMEDTDIAIDLENHEQNDKDCQYSILM
jgi:hypothetical protein